MSKFALGGAFLGSMAFLAVLRITVHQPFGSHLEITPVPAYLWNNSGGNIWDGVASVVNEPGMYLSGSLTLKGPPTIDPAPAGQVQDFSVAQNDCHNGIILTPKSSCTIVLAYRPVANGTATATLRITDGSGITYTDLVQAVTMVVPKGLGSDRPESPR